MDLGLVAFLLILLPGVFSYALSERLKNRASNSSDLPFQATVGILCMSFWDYTIFACLVLALGKYDQVSRVFSIGPQEPYEPIETILSIVKNGAGFLVLLFIISVIIGLLYALVKNYEWDAKLLSEWEVGIGKMKVLRWIGAIHSEGDLRSSFLRMNIWNKHHMQITISADEFILGSLCRIEASGTHIVLQNAQLWRRIAKTIDKRLLLEPKLISQHNYLAVDLSAPNVVYFSTYK